MYVHTRSSSESKATALSVLISIFLLDFLKDFDIEDVLDDINLLFTRTSLDYIIKQENKDEQIFHLIWILQTMHDDQIREFLKKIEKYYDWIVRKIENEVKCHGDETIKYLIKLSSMQSKNHKHTKYNVHRTKEYIALRSALRKLKPHNSVVLLGGLSSGKKWLAYDVCSDFDVLKSMKFKIFWIDCSECISQEKDYEALKNLMYQLKHDHQFYNVNYTKENFIRLKEQIKCLFSEKENNECLLVLCNVQNNKCINAFNLECKRLIITRNRKVSDSMPTSLNKHLELNKGLTLNEFYLLIDKYKNANYDWRMDSIPLANDIYHMSLGEPCSLSIIAKHISQKKSNWIECMKNINNFEISNRKLKQEIEKSLEIFTPDELKLFATLSVFPRCAQIPVKLLAFLWNMRTYETEHFINKLHDHFFVQRVLLDDQETITCCVKFMYSSYIRNCNNIKSITDPLELHSRIVDFYEVKDHLNNRKDVDIDIYSYDGYFFHCIGFHLYRSSYKHLLPTLYTDFGFLGQKIRLVGLNDTIADLHTYSVEIASAERNFSLRKFENFLAKIEEKIKYFPDCCLLQYALFSTEDFIKELALKQVKKFPQRLWFTERNQYQQWRPIFNLPETAKLIRLLDDDLCIVVLSNHKVLLIDLTLGSKCCEMPLMKGINIVDMKIIDDYNHVLTQDCYGSLKLWNITEEKRCISKQRSNANFKPRLKDDTNKKFFHEQIISNYYNPSEKIQTFYVDPNNNRILVAFGGGLLMFFDWNKKDKKYKKSFENPYNVKIKTIHSVCLLNEKHYMIIYYKENNKIDVQFLKRKNTQLENLELKFPDNDKLIYHEVFQNYVIFVFQRYILRLNLIFDSFEKSNLEQLYENHDNIINCAKLLLDNQYLILGTQKGINVFDITKRSVTLQSIVSESISSIDNYDLDDDKYKSMIVCGCNHKNILYIFGLHLTNGSKLDWDHNPLRQNESDELASFEQIYTRYIGNKLFDVCEENDTLYAVDSKNRIHQICLSDTKKISILPSLDVQQNIIGIHCFKSKLIVAFNNGEIYDYLEKRLLVKANDVVEKDFFLKTMDNNILITSNANELTYFKHMQIEHSEKLLQTQTKYCKIIMNTHLLIINNCGAALIFDCEGFFKNPDKVNIVIGIKACNNLSSCDLKDNVLFLGFSQYAVHFYLLYFFSLLKISNIM
ncbi:death-associated APAF1-related killer isoform 2-T2 [Cochliomyia hominivorax]